MNTSRCLYKRISRYLSNKSCRFLCKTISIYVGLMMVLANDNTTRFPAFWTNTHGITDVPTSIGTPRYLELVQKPCRGYGDPDNNTAPPNTGASPLPPTVANVNPLPVTATATTSQSNNNATPLPATSIKSPL